MFRYIGVQMAEAKCCTYYMNGQWIRLKYFQTSFDCMEAAKGTIMDRRKLHAFNRIWTCSYLCVAAEAQFNETVTVKMQLNWTHSLNDHCQWTMYKEAALQLQLTELYNEDRTLSLYNYCSSSHRIIHVWLNDLN